LVAMAVIPGSAMSQAGKKVDPKKAAAERAAGMAGAPPVLQALGISCQVSDARLVGKTEDKKAKTSTSFYEVACAPGAMGFILQAPSAAAPSAFTCIEANTPAEAGKPASLPCTLPGNADPKTALAPLFARAKIACAPTQVRGIGQSKTNTYVEAACQEGPGYIVVASAPFDASKDAQVQNCLNFDDTAGNIKCAFGDKASRLAVVDTYAAAAKNNCVVTGRRYIGASKDGATYFESACQDGKGYIYKIATNGALDTTYECAKAQVILGGCELTNAKEAETAQAGLYTKLAKAAGSSCEVEKYALFPPKATTDDIVELACKDGSSVVGNFSAGVKHQVMNCAYALVAGYKCGLGNMTAAYGVYTEDLKKFDQKSCVVSNSRLAAKTTTGNILIEVACADGLKGYVIEYSPAPNVTAVKSTGCAFAGNCKLPGNV
jgi:hypothetical protein